MKQIGIVTWYVSRNYGTCLQAYALYKVLEKMSYKPYIIGSFEIGNSSFRQYIKRILDRMGILELIRRRRYSDPQGQKILQFISHDIEVRIIHKKSDYKKLIKDISVFVTGSDQIWNPYHTSPFYMLDFADRVKKIAYSSSIGVNSLPEEKVEVYRKYLSYFSHISLREQSGVRILRDILGRDDITSQLDPTFLLGPSDWGEFCKDAELGFQPPNEFILTYLIGNNACYIDSVNSLRKRTGLPVINIRSVENSTLSIPEAINYGEGGPVEFVRLIRDATLVVTDSFHAAALSINMSREFVMLKRFSDNDPISQNSRIRDLLELFDLVDRMYSREVSIGTTAYPQISKILEQMRYKSLKYLRDSIEN